MSHFQVMVVLPEGTDRSAVEDVLEPIMAPFSEEPDDCFLEFNDNEDEYLENYETGFCTKVVTDRGDLNLHELTQDEKDMLKENPFFFDTRVYKYKDMYSTFEEFCKEVECSSERDAKTGRYGYWYNPNAKWDWYVVGGRWSGSLYEVGCAKPVDVCVKKEFDNDRYITEIEAARGKQYDLMHEAETTEFKDEEEKRRFLFENGLFFVPSKKTIETKTREEYVSDHPQIFAPFALIWESKWYQKGDMGWFAITTNVDTCWQSSFSELWKEIPEDSIIAIVDCHI